MSPNDLSYRECCEVVDQIAEFAPLILVLSGGEPLWRRDVFDIAKRAVHKNLRVALATNGTLIDEAMAERIKDAGIARVSISLDGADRATHDAFRGEAGAFDAAIAGLKHLKALGISTQINTSVAQHNVDQLPDILRLAQTLGAEAFHIFLLVPVGCGLTIAEDQTIRGDKYEEVLNWFYDPSTAAWS
jgi:MoaA/NifB/PqqE/SkfB family radical SAM enzyme